MMLKERKGEGREGVISYLRKEVKKMAGKVGKEREGRMVGEKEGGK